LGVEGFKGDIYTMDTPGVAYNRNGLPKPIKPKPIKPKPIKRKYILTAIWVDVDSDGNAVNIETIGMDSAQTMLDCSKKFYSVSDALNHLDRPNAATSGKKYED